MNLEAAVSRCSGGENFKTPLDEVRGAVELSVRVAPAPPAEEVIASSAGGDPATLTGNGQ